MRAHPRLGLARAGSNCWRGSASCPTRSSRPRSTRPRAKGELPDPLCAAHRRGEGGGRRRSRARWSSPPTPSSPPAAASCPRRRPRTRRAPALTLLSGRRHRVHCAVTLIDAEGQARHRLVDLDRRLQAPRRGGDRRLSRRAANGAARRAATRSRAAPRRWSACCRGSYSGVVGLPLYETRALLRAAGYPLG